MKQKRKSYSRDYKMRLVELCKAKGNVSAVSREYGISINSLRRWIKEFDRYADGSFPGRGKPKMTEEEAKIATLKKELADVTEERDILKKAVHFFSKSDGKSTGS
ncbi:transposase [Crocinitomix catalasitica]|nr:transposase [Crocinitomix catalasitica]